MNFHTLAYSRLSLFLVVVVTIAVAISVAVAIAVAVTALAAVGAVEYHGKALEAFVVVDVLQLAKHVAVQQAGADDKERAVAVVLDDLRVGNDVYRRAVDEYVVVAFAHLGDEVLEFVATDELGGVGRNGAHCDDVQVVIPGVGCYDVAYVACAAREVFADAY